MLNTMATRRVMTNKTGIVKQIYSPIPVTPGCSTSTVSINATEITHKATVGIAVNISAFRKVLIIHLFIK